MKLNHSSILVTLLVATLLPAQVFAAKGGNKPPPGPVTAGDVVCDDVNGCIDTSDIVDGAVTSEKLSPGLQDQLSGLSGKQSIGVYVNGVRLGAYLGAANLSNPNMSKSVKEISDVKILLNSGYLTTVLGSGGVYSDLVFYNIDCASQAYLRDGGNLGVVSSNNGVVFEEAGTGELFYIPRGTTEETFDYTSSYINGVCTYDSVNRTTGYKVFPNDKNITGVDSLDFIGDVRLGF
jgi:hypothetical protein